MDALIHVDPENDEINPLPGRMPTRSAVSDAMSAALRTHGLTYNTLNLHYLSGGLDIDVTIDEDLTVDQLASLEHSDFVALNRRLGAREMRVMQIVRKIPNVVITESATAPRPD